MKKRGTTLKGALGPVITPEVADEPAAEAERGYEGRSVSDLAREAVELYLGS